MSTPSTDSESQYLLVCPVCGIKEKKMKRCIRCQKAYYCSRICQARDWSKHKLDCYVKTDNDSDKCAKLIPTQINFEGAAEALGIKTEDDKDDNKLFITSTQISKFPNIDPEKPVINITVRCQKEKHKIEMQDHWEGQDIIEKIIDRIRVPLSRLTLIHKGKKVSADNIKLLLNDKAVFQAIGEIAENEDGLNQDDITVLMKQISVERNVAVKALRQSGDVVDAILHITEK